MSRSDRKTFLDALRDMRNGLVELGAPWVVIGGVAVISLGVTRYTQDIDATIEAGVSPERALEVLGRHGIRPRVDDAAGFARMSQVLLLVHERSGVPIDLGFGWTPFEREAIAAGRVADWKRVKIPVLRPEDAVISKLVASRPQDLQDVERLLLLHGRDVDVARIRRTLVEFAEVLDDPGPVRELDRLLALTRTPAARGGRPGSSGGQRKRPRKRST